MNKKLIPKCQTGWTPLVKQEEYFQPFEIPEISEVDRGTIT